MPVRKNFRLLFNLFLLIGFCLFIQSCKTSQNSAKKAPERKNVYVKNVSSPEGIRSIKSFNVKEEKRAEIVEIIKDARKYLGAPYLYGGNTAKGVDCSGLMCMIFKENDIKLPRRSVEQYEQGIPIKDSEIKVGDLLFFAPGGGKTVSHVGLVQYIHPDGEINFIHASSSKGVIISSLNEKYWNKAYLGAKRYITKK